MCKLGFFVVFSLALVFTLASCDTDPMSAEVKVNPLVGSWATAFNSSSDSVSFSIIQFFADGAFVYTVTHFDLTTNEQLPPMSLREHFEGTYTFTDNVIFFDIREPSEHRGVTHSFFLITEGVSEDGEEYVALYCRGEKFLFTSNLHFRVEPE